MSTISIFAGTQAGFGPDEWEQAFTESPRISFAPDGSFAVAWSYIDVFWEQDPYYGTVSQVFGAEHNVVEFFTSDGVSKGLPQEVPGRQPDVAFDPASALTPIDPGLLI